MQSCSYTTFLIYSSAPGWGPPVSGYCSCSSFMVGFVLAAILVYVVAITISSIILIVEAAFMISAIGGPS